MNSIYKSEVINNIQPEHLPEHYRIVVETCGLETAQILIQELSGIQINVPMIPRMNEFIESYVNSNKEKNPKLIATQLGISERRVRAILRKKEIPQDTH